MARLGAKRASPDGDDEAETRRAAAARRVGATTPLRATQPPSESPSPAVSFSSDKENSRARSKSSSNTVGLPSRSSTATSSTARRRGLEERNATNATNPPSNAATATPTVAGSSAAAQPARGREEDEEEEGGSNEHSILDTRYYDPEQTLVERRPVRKAIRDLTRELQESRNEYMAAHSSGIYDTVLAANQQFAQIKQTSDATLDSNLLVKAADLAARRAVQLAHGGAARGVDAGEFAARCAAFMRRGPAADFLHGLSADARAAVDRGHGRTRIMDDDDDGGINGGAAGDATQADDGDELNWAWLGLRAAQPSNMRPPTPGFLLGPLSIQKKARAATQRTQRQGPLDPADAVRPAELGAEQLEKRENANLTALCRKIFKLLRGTQARALDAVQAFVEARGDDLTGAELSDVLEQNHLRDDKGIDLLHFAFNPHSFGQTVENLFYISFLVRDGKAGLAADAAGRPSLHPTDPTAPEARHFSTGNAKGSAKKQAVFHLDFDTWRRVCEEFDVTASIIPHRSEDGPVDVGAEGWYG